MCALWHAPGLTTVIPQFYSEQQLRSHYYECTASMCTVLTALVCFGIMFRPIEKTKTNFENREN